MDSIVRIQQRSSSQTGMKRLRQQQLQLGRSSVDQSDGEKRQQRFWPCPICNRSFALFRLDDHVNQCLDSSPCSKPSRSPTLSAGDGSLNPSTVELLPAACTQEQHEGTDVRMSSWISSVRIPSFHVKETEQSSALTYSDSSSTFYDSKFEAVHCSDLQRASLAGQRDVGCLQTERCLSPEDNSLEPRNENVVEGGCYSVEEEDEEKPPLTCTLEYPGGNHGRDCGNTDLSSENLWTGDEKGLVEDGKDKNGVLMGRPPAGFKLFQRQVQSQARLSMFPNFSSAPLQRKPSVTVLQPGMVLFRSWLDLDTQQKFVQESQGAALLFRRPTTAGGGKYHVYSMCWGSKWDAKTRRYVVKGPEHPIPAWMFELSQRLAREAHQHTPVYPMDSIYSPDVGLVNFYPVKADELGVIGLGGHQDLDDSGLMPVVSVSIGDSMTFFYRRLPPFSRRKSGVSISVDEEAARSCKDGDAAHNRENQILLESGDVLVFGGKSRLLYHGTRHVQPGTRPSGLHMVPGRLNFTFRQTVAKASELV